MANQVLDSAGEHPILNLALLIPIAGRQLRDEIDPEVLKTLPHENYGTQVNFTIWILCGLAAGFMGLRIYCKYSRHRGLWWDDYVLILSWVALATAAAITSVAISYGYGQHLYDIDPEKVKPMTKIANFAGFSSVLAALWSKTSFAITLLRISDGWLKRLVWFIIISTNMVMGASAILVWVKVAIEIRIITFIITTTYSGAMDIILAFLPWKIIWSLVMNRKEKFGVAFAMSMGVFAGATSLIKALKVEGLRSTDPVDSVQLVIFGAAESAITIIAASIPILRVLIRESTPKMPQFYHLDQWHESDAKLIKGGASPAKTGGFSKGGLGTNFSFGTSPFSQRSAESRIGTAV